MIRSLLLINLLASALIFQSCATLLNSRTERISIRSSEPTQLVYQGDTLHELSYEKELHVPRGKEPLYASVITLEDREIPMEVNSGESFAFWLNGYTNYGIGMLIDMDNPRRYSYPREVYIDVENDEYFPFVPIDAFPLEKRNVFKLNPFRLLGPIHPGFELSYERFHNYSVSTQLSVAFLSNSEEEANFDYAGYRLGIEQRFYFSRLSRFRPFLGFEI
ncbi:MAG: hypothetical protein AAF361_12405, partial [Bacteroidota bacterium]